VKHVRQPQDVQIQWGDCDPANSSISALFRDVRRLDLDHVGGRRFSKQDIIKNMVWSHSDGGHAAKFYIASTHVDWIAIESRIESFKRSSFEV